MSLYDVEEQHLQPTEPPILERTDRPLFHRHQALRLVAVAIGIVATRHLYVDNFHYPLFVLLGHGSGAILLEVHVSWKGLHNSNREHGTPTVTTTWASIAWQLIFAGLVATTLVLTYQAMLHTLNTTLFVMMMYLGWSNIIRSTGQWLRRERRWSMSEPLCVSAFLICVGLLLLRENRLTEKGAKLILAAAISAASTKVVWESGVVDDHLDLRIIHPDAYIGGLMFCLPLVGIIVGVTRWHTRRDFSVASRVVWILLSLAAGAVALCSESTLKKLSGSAQDRETRPARRDISISSVWSTLIILAAVEADNLTGQSRPTITTATQWAGFALGCLATVDVSRLSPAAVSMPVRGLLATGFDFKILNKLSAAPSDNDSEETERLYVGRGADMEEESVLLQRFCLAFHAIVSGLTVILVVHSVLNLSSPMPSQFPVRQESQGWDLDIVIARYAEPIDHIIDTVNLVLQNPALSLLKTRTIVYNKGVLNDTELSSKFPAESELLIKNLANVGREGETFISHLFDEQQDYAKHTLFMQAEPHVTDFLQTRLKNYFVKETGFLSLSYPYRFCPDCDRCNDFSGWNEKAALVHDIFERSNRNETCRDISLTYRGQFIVSSKRMRQVNHQLLRDLRSRLLDDFVFGYSLERFWGTILQCSRISERCPTMLSEWLGNFGGGDVEDCQCLDS